MLASTALRRGRGGGGGGGGCWVLGLEKKDELIGGRNIMLLVRFVATHAPRCIKTTYPYGFKSLEVLNI